MKKHISLTSASKKIDLEDTILTENFSFLEQSAKINRMTNDVHATNKTTSENGSKKTISSILKDSMGDKVIC